MCKQTSYFLAATEEEEDPTFTLPPSSSKLQTFKQQWKAPSPADPEPDLEKAASESASAVAAEEIPDSRKQYRYHCEEEEELQRWPTAMESLQELRAVTKIALPMVLTGLLMYPRAMVSMLFLGHLGELDLAGGSLAIGFANITGYSVISGLAMGMEPICGQAFGAKRWQLLGLTLQRTVLVLLCACAPISLLWLNMDRILLFCGQDPLIVSKARIFIIFSLPDLLLQALIHPIRIYLRSQNITLPLTYCAAGALILHVPINLALVVALKLGIAGVAMAAVMTNLNLVLLLLCYIKFSGACAKSWSPVSQDCLRGWRTLLRLAIPSCVSVCLEWWWYEFMIILCGLLANPRATVASMGILIQTTSLVYIFPSSLSFAVSTRVGNELGANRPGKARRAMIVAMACSVILGVTAMLFATGMRHTWAAMFTRDAEILALTALVLPVIGLCELGNCPQTTGCGVLRGTARPSIGANINLGSFYFIGMPVAIMMGFVFGWDFEGLWLGLLAAQASCVSFMVFVLIRTDWSVQARRAQELLLGSECCCSSSSSSANVVTIVTTAVTTTPAAAADNTDDVVVVATDVVAVSVDSVALAVSSPRNDHHNSKNLQ